ncbi:sensor histidine kinase [Streptomyces sp. NPDC018031]|uniref:sensor histidine kinase n=1 Tax=Streptomyces sp. NPDC018031 TaxID=3365033 RepID=UPI0037AECDD6
MAAAPSAPPPARAFPLLPRPWWRMPPGWLAALSWCAGAAFTFLIRTRLPGESQAAVNAGVLFYRWDGLATLTVATAMALSGCGLLARRPLAAIGLLLAGAATASIALSVGEIPMAQFLAVDVALYLIAATRPRRTGITALAMALGVLAGYLATRLLCGWEVGTSAELAVALTAVIAWLIGSSAREAREHARQVREQAAVQAVTAERLRIARELHDMVAHTIGIVALQAGAARRVIDTQPARAREALGAVEEAGRETLAGLRRMLGALRQTEHGTGPEPGSLAPAAGLADVDRLAAAATAAGVRVDVRWRGRRPLPPEIELSAFRIVQESVTNVVRHAGTGSCRVSIDCGAEVLAIEVVDGGRGGSGVPSGGGYGLAGMRERVGLLRGEFSAGPRPGGGFRVAALLPVPAAVR